VLYHLVAVDFPGRDEAASQVQVVNRQENRRVRAQE